MTQNIRKIVYAAYNMPIVPDLKGRFDLSEIGYLKTDLSR